MLHILGFTLLVVLVYVGMQYYVAFWLLRHFPGMPIGAGMLRCSVLLLGLCFPLSIYLLRHGSPAAQGFALAMYLWTGTILICLPWAAGADVAGWLLRRLAAPAAWRTAAAWLAVVGVLTTSAYAVWNAARLPAVVRLELALPRLPRSLDGLTLVQLSDVHVGLTMPVERFARIVDQVNALDPDLVLLTGDLMDPGKETESAVRDAGERLRAKRGKFAVLGNHEFYHGLGRSAALLQDCGFRLLRNETVVAAGGLQVCGIDDVSASGLAPADLERVLARLDRQLPAILLSHQPRLTGLAARRGVGLMLAGHTHGGQIFPFGLVPRLIYGFLHGLYRKDGMALFVSSGAGHWGPPMRFLTRSEIVVIVLRSPS